jgi:hypothetical protein
MEVTMDDRAYQISNLQKILGEALMSPVFRENPKYDSKGAPRIDYNDVMNNKYIIKSDTDFPGSGSYWCNENAEFIVQYTSIDDLVDDGWRLD